MANRRRRDLYTKSNLRLLMGPLIALVAFVSGKKIAVRARGKVNARASTDAAFLRRLRHKIEYPRRRGRKIEPGVTALLLDRLEAAGVTDARALDKLIAGDREAARHALELKTLAQTDRLMAALKRAREDLGP